MVVSLYGLLIFLLGVVWIFKDFDCDIYGCDVLIVEDVVDFGFMFLWLLWNLMSWNLWLLWVCMLLCKFDVVYVNVEIVYVGFDIFNDFVVGYGLDYDECYCDLLYIGMLDFRVYQQVVRLVFRLL